ncbi:MAG: AI-2E family transporter [Patescibacteria group bacterium]|jgi:predicted PurR-regulated permease PerM
MPNLNQSLQINISTKTVLKILVIVLAILFLYMIKSVLAIIFVSWVLASAIDPLVDKMQKYKFPRWLSILLVYLVMVLLIVLVITLFVPPVINEISNLTNDLPTYIEKLQGILENVQKAGAQYGLTADADKIFNSISSAVTGLSSGIFNAATGFVGGLLAFIAIMVIIFYMTVQEEGIKNFIQSVVPAHYQPYIIQKINRIQHKLGSWLWGQVLLMFIIGIITAIALKIIGVPYVLVLAIFAGLCEFIPIVGPIVSAVPAVLFALADAGSSPVKPILVIIVYIVIQQIENQFLVPKIMNKAVGLNPIVVIITILIGAQIGGIFGVILAVPAATIISIFLEDFLQSKRDEANKLEGEEYIKEQIKK